MNNVLQLIDRPHEDGALLTSFLLGRPTTTQRTYKNELRLFAEFINKPLRFAVADDLRAYMEKGRLSKLRPSTLRNKISVVKGFYSWLYAEEHLPNDPMLRVATPPQVPPDGSRCLTTKQVRSFFAQIPIHRTIGLRDRAIFMIGATCGLRLAELSRASIGDVSEGGEEGGNAGWMKLRVHGKGGRDRVVDVRPEAWGVVQEYLRKRRDELAPSAPLFASIRRGSSVRPQARDLRIPGSSIYGRFKKYARAAELPRWSSPHCLRHYFASEAHKHGAPAEAIRKALGHTSLSTTQRYLDGISSGLNVAFVMAPSPIAKGTS